MHNIDYTPLKARSLIQAFILKSSLDSLLDIDSSIQPEYCDPFSSINYVKTTFSFSVIIRWEDNKAITLFSEGDQVH